ncbi:hypothetical protein lbkm_3023 [Lachnospiraceae bacterium KM106-2]|nr:hypothetical protein lbkm_3023 [Lachnospiraceae bacterium KM106-2]
MQSDALTLYKLIILYILNKVDFPLTNAQLCDFILEKEYTTYFNIQQAISELHDSELVTSKTVRNSSYYRITDAGEETLEFFENKISDAIKADIMDYLRKNKYSLRDEVSNLADYYEEKKNEYIVRCQVKEQGSSIIDLSLIVPTEDAAISICNNWKKKSQNVYSYLMKTLLESE